MGKANSAQNALEEARTLLEQSDRARRVTEQELSDTNEQLSEQTCTNQAMVGAARLADELRNEQDMAQGFERDRKLLECQVKDMQARLDDAETNALKGGKKAMNKMETRIREL